MPDNCGTQTNGFCRRLVKQILYISDRYINALQNFDFHIIKHAEIITLETFLVSDIVYLKKQLLSRMWLWL